jgi:3-oxoacyl-[acyl-carrier protein] reductase
MSEELQAWHAQQSPLGRTGKPADTAELVASRCSARSGWITGQILDSDGGWSALRVKVITSLEEPLVGSWQ